MFHISDTYLRCYERNIPEYSHVTTQTNGNFALITNITIHTGIVKTVEVSIRSHIFNMCIVPLIFLFLDFLKSHFFATAELLSRKLLLLVIFTYYQIKEATLSYT